MFKLIIVDDEYLIRESLKRSIPWQEWGIDFQGEANHGKTALELIDRVKPDLVLTDIRMPVMDGIELAKKIKEKYAYIKVLFISGYSDFSYAQQAFKLGVNDYILKPIDNEQVKESLERIIQDMCKEREYTDEIESIRKHLYVEKPIIVNRLFNNLIRNVSLFRKKESLRRLNAFGLHLAKDNGTYGLIVFKIKNQSTLTRKINEEERQIFLFGIMNIATEILIDDMETYMFESGHDEVSAIVHFSTLPDHKSRQRLLNKVLYIQDRVKEFFRIDVISGISRVHPNVENLEICYEEAIRAIATFYMSSSDTIFLADDMLTETNEKNARVVEKAKAYIEEHLSKDISILEIAQYVGLSQNYFSNVFKQRSGKTLLDYIISKKMEVAYHYVTSTDLKIYEIAEHVGFQDAKYFNKVFKKYFNVVPSDLRHYSR
jgi:two-component system response regulator YesN